MMASHRLTILDSRLRGNDGAEGTIYHLRLRGNDGAEDMVYHLRANNQMQFMSKTKNKKHESQ